MKTHDSRIICRLPQDLHTRVKTMCQDIGQNQSKVLREGLLTLLRQWEIKKRDEQMMRQF
jgi:hypothetical protein